MIVMPTYDAKSSYRHHFVHPDLHNELVAQLDWLLVNRDLNGRVRFIVPENIESNVALREQVGALYQGLADRLALHAYPVGSG